MEPASREISDITRERLIGDLFVSGIPLFGRLDEVDFLGRIYELKKMPSTDRRFKDMAGDIWQHRVSNNDWSDEWFWYDERLELRAGPDETLLRFLAETLHPAVRWNSEEREALLTIMNSHLIRDGWEIAEVSETSGYPIYAGRRSAESTPPPPGIEAAHELDLGRHVFQQVSRMRRALADDPDLAIGTAKEFVETICRTILQERGLPVLNDDLPALTRAAVRSLPLAPASARNQTAAIQTLDTLANNLASIGRSLAELRNEFGTGHGREAGHEGLGSPQAKLAVGIATSLGVFLFEIHQQTKGGA